MPVGLCTAYDTFKDDIKSVAADFYVVKSSDLDELKNRIATTLHVYNKNNQINRLSLYA